VREEEQGVRTKEVELGRMKVLEGAQPVPAIRQAGGHTHHRP